MSESITEAAGDDFGQEPSVTIGTGPYMLTEWTRNSQILLCLSVRSYDRRQDGHGYEQAYDYGRQGGKMVIPAHLPELIAYPVPFPDLKLELVIQLRIL